MKSLMILLVMAMAYSIAKEEPLNSFKASTKSQLTLKRVLRNVLISQAKRWPKNQICYRFSSKWSPDHRALIREAMDYIENCTYVHFTEDTRRRRQDCVSILPAPPGSGCSSNIGYLRGPQKITLPNGKVGTGCFQKYILVHELLHTCGMYHQQSSPDRDKYVKIIKANIKPSQLINFAKMSKQEVTTFGLSYDFNSIMHYGPKTASRNGKDTIVPLNGEVIGQRMEMSDIDVKKMLLMYPERKTNKTKPVKPVKHRKENKRKLITTEIMTEKITEVLKN